MNSSRGGRIFALALGATACASGGGSDPSLWAPTKDFGGTQVQLPTANGTSGTAAVDHSSAAATSGPGGQSAFAAGGGTPASGGAAGTRSNDGRGGNLFIGSGGVAESGGAAGSGGAANGTGGTTANTGGSVSGTAGSTNSGPSKCTFSFDVTTVTARGRFAPRNAGAIWISDAQNKFVKTLRWWGFIEVVQATAWEQASGGNKVDAVSGATRVAHGALNATWDCTDVSHLAVADGNYIAHVTFAESDANPFTTSIQASVPFTKSASGADVMGQDTANFVSMHVKLTVP